jgi:hypothetical protein
MQTNYKKGPTPDPLELYRSQSLTLQAIVCKEGYCGKDKRIQTVTMDFPLYQFFFFVDLLDHFFGCSDGWG